MMKMVQLNLQLIILSLQSAAPRPDNMASESQNVLPVVGDISMNALPPTSDLEIKATHPECSAEVNDLAISNATGKGKKRRRASSGAARSKSLIFYCPALTKQWNGY
jgi:hypothetical protein